MTPPGGDRTKGHGEKRQRGGHVRLADLSERDLAILTDLARVRLATGRLIERLHFRDGSPLTAARKSRSSLQRLKEQGLISSLDRRIGGVRAGSSGYVYGLTGRCQALLHANGPAGGARRRKSWEPSHYFIDHILAVSTLYVELVEADRAGALELLGFQAEPAAWRRWHSLGGEHAVLKPDAFVHLAVGDYEHLAFVEIDRATESKTVIRRKARAYVDYWMSGTEQARSGIFPRVVWLTTTEARAEALTDVLATLDPEHWQLFQVGHIDDQVSALTGQHISNQTKGDNHESTNGPRGTAA